MQLSDICVSLELAKQLKEAGFPQESLFMWGQLAFSGDFVLKHRTAFLKSDVRGGLPFAAPTSGELSEHLPEIVLIKNQAFRLVVDMDKNRRWFVNYVAYQPVQNAEGYCDLSVFEKDASFFDIWTDNFGMTGLHLRAEKSLAEVFGHTWLYLKHQGLLSTKEEE